MEPIRDNIHAAEVVTEFFYTGSLSEPHREALKAFVFAPSIFSTVVKTCEYLYAHRDEIDDVARMLVARLASFAAQNGWGELGHDNRGGLIHQAMARDLGRKLLPGQPKPQAAENDPAPLAEYARAIPAPASPPEMPDPVPPPHVQV
jgi:hypothetical protein